MLQLHHSINGDIDMSFSTGNGGGSASISSSQDVALASPVTNQVLTYDAAIAKWKNAPVTGGGSQEGVINVKDYGATGNGSTDDTAAVIAARNVVLASYNSVPVSNAVPLILYFPAGAYKITSADALMFSPESGTAQELRGLTIRGAGKRTTQINFSTSQGATTDPTQGNLMTLANRVRGLRVSDICFNSTNANQSLCYMWCSDTKDANSVRPEYGAGAQNDIVWEEVRLSGTWKRGWGFDGDTQANLNSEQTWRMCNTANSATFTDAVIRSGFIPFSPQQDQFLNYNFYDCQFEYSYGDFFVADMGGFINVYGGSFINGISTTVGSTWFKMGNRAHAYDVKHLNVIGTRFELRNTNCKLIDTYWSGTAAHITFTGITISNSAIPAGSQAEHEVAVFRNSSGGTLPYVKFANCFLPGYMSADLSANTPANQGVMSFEMCGFRNYNGGATLGTSGTFLRYTTGVPKYRYTDCFNTSTGAN
jgi:hypothetical protein